MKNLFSVFSGSSVTIVLENAGKNKPFFSFQDSSVVSGRSSI